MFDKNIYVSTIIDSYNYGTVLQAAATRDVLEPYGKPLFIDYCREAWTRKGLRIRTIPCLSTWFDIWLRFQS